MKSKGWLLIYFVVVIIFILIMLHIATSKDKIRYDLDNGADQLEILDDPDDEELKISDNP